METPTTQDAHSTVELQSFMSGESGTTKVSSLCNCSGKDAYVKPDGQKKPPQDRHGLVVTFVIQLACFLWLASIVTLLTFNFTQFVVGASAWCPHRKCNPLLFDDAISTPIENLQRFDKQDHNLLGALQIVAKLLEIWFTLIAAALVSKLTFRLASREEGLPMELLTRPSGFADLPGTLDPLLRKAMPSTLNPKTLLPGIPGRLWKAMISIFKTNWKRKILRGWPLHAFIVFTAVLCVVCNFMGPAVAVLVLPTLRWIPTEAIGDRTFESMGASEPPQQSPGGEKERYFAMYTDCDESDFENLTFSCAADPHASKLDSWIGTYVAAGDYVDGLTQEWSVKFRVNQTSSVIAHGPTDDQQYTTVTWWTPCRQLLSSLDDDQTMVQLMSRGVGDDILDLWYGDTSERQVLDSPDTYANYNNSLRLLLQRKGPVLGAVVQMHQDPEGTATWTTTIDEDRSIRCFKDYDLGYAPFYEQSVGAVSSGYYTKCVRVGSGWSESNMKVGFTIIGEHNYTTNVTGPNVEISIFSSDKAQFFKNNTYPSWLPSECLQNGTVPSTAYCDWERLFDTDPDEHLYNRTQNVLTTEMSIKQANTNGSETLVSRLTVDFVASLGFTSYELDASPLTNPTALATFQSLPNTSSIIYVDPAWMLAAWTVDNEGTLNPDRTAPKEVLRTMQRFSSNAFIDEDGYVTDLDLHLSYISLLPVTQVLSMIDYNTTAHSNPKVAAAEGERYPDYPHLTRNAQIYVWTYGISGRTSKFGIAVVCIGIAIVLAQVVLGFVDRRKPPSLDQLLVAALEYVPRKDINGTRLGDEKVAKTRFLVEEKEAYQGQYAFKRPEAVV